MYRELKCHVQSLAMRKPDEAGEVEDISHIFLHMPSANHPINAIGILVGLEYVLRMANESGPICEACDN